MIYIININLLDQKLIYFFVIIYNILYDIIKYDKVKHDSHRILRTVLDGGTQSNQRWQKWRPTISLCQHEDMIIDRFELLIDERHQALADQTAKDIKQSFTRDRGQAAPH